jgi:seryl-tRNA(Sec) selenium transferase
VAVAHPERNATALERALRLGEIPVIARIDDGVLLIDLRAVPETDDDLLRGLIVTALAP